MAEMDESGSHWWHWVMTLHLPGSNELTAEGLIDAGAVQTRRQAYHTILAGLRERNPVIPEEVSVLFFSLEPNNLTDKDN